ncbi:hypothetical protein [Dickeya dianthicola]|uniref:hypothetical protein n=1 Tax=Dickeya dianthicola TaxID=204039 RepID=UPI0018DFAAFA|nr:hypothetical protein [Dickeya dianthicola]
MGCGDKVLFSDRHGTGKLHTIENHAIENHAIENHAIENHAIEHCHHGEYRIDVL